MSTDEFTKLFKYMSERFDKIDSTLDNKAETKDLQKVIGTLDALEKRMEISDDERLVINHQLTRMHEWIDKAAERIDLKFVH